MEGRCDGSLRSSDVVSEVGRESQLTFEMM